MKNQFIEGDYVFYNNPGSHFHLMMFQLSKIVPMTLNSPGGYELTYGSRHVFAKVDQVLHRSDPQLKQMQTIPHIPALLPAVGQELDDIGRVLGLSRIPGETDESYRAELHKIRTGQKPTFPIKTSNSIPPGEAHFVQDGKTVGKIINIGANPHAGHDVITNHAGGKEFKYCRKCKVEVYE